MSRHFDDPVKLDQIGQGLRVDISASHAEREDIALDGAVRGERTLLIHGGDGKQRRAADRPHHDE